MQCMFLEMMKGLFSFENDNICQTKIDDSIWLRMERIGPSIARFYFVNESRAEIDIPEHIVVFAGAEFCSCLDGLLHCFLSRSVDY